MTTSVRISLEELRRLRSRAYPPDPGAFFSWFCSSCDRPFKEQGITLLCPHCRTWTEKYGLRDLGEASGS